MVREYIDLYAKKLDERMILSYVSYGFKHVCVADDLDAETLGKARSLGLMIYRKKILLAKSRSELLSQLRGLRENAIVSVVALTRDALMVAARDGRVSTILFHGEMAEVDRHVLQVVKNSFEVSVEEVIKCSEVQRCWRNLLLFMQIAQKYDLHVAFSSGASTPEEVLPPTQIAYVAAALKGLKAAELEVVSNKAAKVLMRLRR